MMKQDPLRKTEENLGFIIRERERYTPINNPDELNLKMTMTILQMLKKSAILLMNFLCLIFPLALLTQEPELKENRFVIVIPSNNNKDWYQKNLDSVFNQRYLNYRVIYIDDGSTDNTGTLVED